MITNHHIIKVVIALYDHEGFPLWPHIHISFPNDNQIGLFKFLLCLCMQMSQYEDAILPVYQLPL